MNFTQKIIGFSLVSTLVVILANSIFPSMIVLGNFVTSSVQAFLATGILIGVSSSLIEHIVDDFKFKMSQQTRMVVYYIINTGVIYFLARTPVSKMIGFGIVGFWVAFLLSIFVTGAQMLFAKTMDKKW